MQTALNCRDAIAATSEFLESFMRGRSGYTSGDVRAATARLKSHCLALQKLSGESDRVLIEAATELIARADKRLRRSG